MIREKAQNGLLFQQLVFSWFINSRCLFKNARKRFFPFSFFLFEIYARFFFSSRGNRTERNARAKGKENSREDRERASASHTNAFLHATPFNYVTFNFAMRVTWIVRFHEKLRLLVLSFLSSAFNEPQFLKSAKILSRFIKSSVPDF